MTRRRTLLTAASLTASITAVVALFAPSATAADKPEEKVEGPSAIATLHGVDPAVLRPDSTTLTLTGTVVNNGDQPLENVQALPRYSKDSLESRADIRRVATDNDLRWGKRYDEPYDVVADVLQPGESAEFELEIAVDSMGLTDPGVYVAGVDIRGKPVDGERFLLDTSRTVFPWLPDDDPLPTVPVALLWPVTARPSLLPSGVFLDESLAGQVAQGGPLDAMVDAVNESPRPVPVTWFVDPDVLTSVDAMAGGYEVRADEDVAVGVGAEAAAEWRSAFDSTTRDADMMFFPYARPDVDALTADDPEFAAQLAEQSAAASTAATGSIAGQARTDVAWPDGRTVTGEALSVLADSGARQVVLPTSAVDNTGTRTQVTVDAGDDTFDAVLTDPGLDSAISDALAATDPAAAALDLQQRWLAETAMVAIEAVGDEQVRPLVAAPPQRWSPDSATAAAVVRIWTSAPWVAPTTLDELPEPTEREAVDLAPDDPAEALPASNVAATATLAGAASHYTTLLADPGSLGEALGGAALRSASTGWRDDPAAGVAYTSTVTTELTSRMSQVSVVLPESVTLASSQGDFPLTVTNDLDEAVTVRLDVRSTNVDRLRIKDVQPQRVEPGEKATILVTAEAATNGKVPIDVQLVAGDGAPIGPPHRTVVNATGWGTIGWLVVGGAIALFGLALVRRVIRGRPGAADHSAADDHPAGEPTAPATTTSTTATTDDGGSTPVARVAP